MKIGETMVYIYDKKLLEPLANIKGYEMVLKCEKQVVEGKIYLKAKQLGGDTNGAH